MELCLLKLIKTIKDFTDLKKIKTCCHGYKISIKATQFCIKISQTEVDLVKSQGLEQLKMEIMQIITLHDSECSSGIKNCSEKEEDRTHRTAL